MNNIERGQVLWLVLPFNNSGDISQVEHPYVVIDVDADLNVCELVQLDSVDNKGYKTLMKSNKLIMHTGPTETAIYKASFAQLDNTIKVELFPGLAAYRKTTDRLSNVKLEALTKAYRKYHAENIIDENKIVFVAANTVAFLNQ